MPTTIVGVLILKDLVDLLADGKPLDVRAHDAAGAGGDGPLRRAARAARDPLVDRRTWRWSSTSTATSRASSPRATCSRRSPARSSEEEGDEPAFVVREDGSYLVSAWMPVDEFADKIGVPIPKDAKYETVAGFVLEELAHLPQRRRDLRARALAVRGARPRRPPHRQGAGEQDRLRAAAERLQRHRRSR